MILAFLSDIHANIYALEAVFKKLDKLKVDKIVVSGDLIGYYYWPKQVVELLCSDPRVVCIKGNHEQILEEARGSLSSLEKYRKKYGSGYQVCLDDLNTEQLDWLKKLPQNRQIVCDSKSIYTSHGTLSTLDQYLYPSSDQKKLEENYSLDNVTVLGHTHYPMFHSLNSKFLLNPGSVGQPRDVGGLASYATMNTDNNVFQFHRCSFDTSDIRSTAKKNDPHLKYLWEIMER